MHEGSYRGGWRSLFDHLLSWGLSMATARPHFSSLHLVTDSAGAELLVDRLGLAFDSVSISLDRLHAHDPDIWILGKLSAYREQTEPFLHIDSDVYLWQPPPPEFLAADVAAAYPEYLRLGNTYYRSESFKAEVRRAGGWLPEALDRYIPVRGILRAENCGVVGGRRTDFISHYADQALRLIEHPDNQLAWSRRGQMQADSLILEQHMLSAELDRHRNDPQSPFHGIAIRYLFAGEGDAASNAGSRGFTHLIGGAKHNGEALDRLAGWVQDALPDHYARCLEIARQQAGAAAAL
jgi:hypothetical protein